MRSDVCETCPTTIALKVSNVGREKHGANRSRSSSSEDGTQSIGGNPHGQPRTGLPPDRGNGVNNHRFGEAAGAPPYQRPVRRSNHQPDSHDRGAAPHPSTHRKLRKSSSVRLRERVYNDVVPGLAVAVAEASEGAFAGERADLDFLYRETLVLLFRILFIAYAEDRELLPYRSSEAYRQAALKTMARRLADAHDAGLSWEDTQTTALWADLNKLREAVDEGSPAWSVPAYDGGLFSSDPDTSVVGAALAGITLPDSRLAPALTALLVEKVDDGACGPIDFRTLSVRDFGTIYEGLLESSLSRAPFDLSVAVDNEGRESFVRAEPDAEIVVPVGSIYHHNRSGERKSTGSYFTKEVAVEHLLERALEPALSRHLTRVSALLESANELAARDAFFDFRCVDLAMGSGHFLVAAVDHIEERFTSFLVEHPISGVSAELGRLEASAADLLGQRADFEIETSTLMRRLIARRCVYGVDRNEIAVELARLSIWIHTFVPGLPLSYLDHNLVVGDSLTGIARIDEVLGAVLDAEESGTASFFEGQILAWLDEASASLRRLANVADATPPEIREARRAHAEAKEAVEPVRRLFDLVCAIRRGEAARFTGEINHDTINEHADLRQTELASKAFQALHFPVAFPEVFLRTNPGFDCIIGNPPWDKVLWEPMQFWIPRMPGLNTLGPTRRDAEMGRLRELYPADAVMEERHAAERRRYQEHVKSAYWQQGSAHYDSAKLFVERALQLLQKEGAVGLVLPRQALVLGGWAKLRDLLFTSRSYSSATQALLRLATGGGGCSTMFTTATWSCY